MGPLVQLRPVFGQKDPLDLGHVAGDEVAALPLPGLAGQKRELFFQKTSSS